MSTASVDDVGDNSGGSGIIALADKRRENGTAGQGLTPDTC